MDGHSDEIEKPFQVATLQAQIRFCGVCAQQRLLEDARTFPLSPPIT